MKKYLKSVSVLIVTHNHKKDIEKLISSIIAQKYVNVFICDANSTDGTLDLLMNSPFAVNVLAKKSLESFSKNNNDLIRHFKLNSEYFLLLNPDTYFDTDFIGVLYETAQADKDIGIVSPILKYPNNDIQVSWKKFPDFFQVVTKRLGISSSKNETQMQGPIIDWCLGACMLIKSEMMKENNTLLDERFRLYCEDIDICFRAKVSGLKVIGEKKASIYHGLNEKSTKQILSIYNYWNISSIIKFLYKWNFKYVFRGKVFSKRI